MMKLFKNTLSLSVAVLVSLAFASPVSAGHGASESYQQETRSSIRHVSTMGRGVIHSVDIENRMVNLTHEPIPALKWAEMTMDLSVTEGVDLADVKPGQSIHFHIVLGEDKVYRITKIITPETEQQCEAGMDCLKHDDTKHSGHHGHGDHH